MPKASRATRTTVWIAIPPRMLPIAIPRSPENAALAVIAISGRLVAIASRIRPPSACPRPRREARTSVASECRTPASQTAAAAARKTRIGTSTATPSPFPLNRPVCRAGSFYDARWWRRCFLTLLQTVRCFFVLFVLKPFRHLTGFATGGGDVVADPPPPAVPFEPPEEGCWPVPGSPAWLAFPKSRQGSPRRPGQGGRPVGTFTPGTTGSKRLEAAPPP